MIDARPRQSVLTVLLAVAWLASAITAAVTNAEIAAGIFLGISVMVAVSLAILRARGRIPAISPILQAGLVGVWFVSLALLPNSDTSQAAGTAKFFVLWSLTFAIVTWVAGGWIAALLSSPRARRLTLKYGVFAFVVAAWGSRAVLPPDAGSGAVIATGVAMVLSTIAIVVYLVLLWRGNRHPFA